MNSSIFLDEFFANMPRLKQAMTKIHDTDAPHPTRAQMGIMYSLSKKDMQSIKELAESFHMTSSGVTQLVDTIVKQGYASREESPEDRRKLCISLTAEGKTVMKQLHQERIKAFREFLSPLSEEELGQLAAIQKKLIDHFQNQST